MFNWIFERWFLKILVVINFLGTIWGFWWYHEQLSLTPLAWWPLVPDSPFASACFTITLVLFLAGKRSKWFHLIACFLSIKYGIWAVAVISDNWLAGNPMELEQIMLWSSHMGMAAEGIIYLGLIWPRKLSWIPFVIFTWLNDGADYLYNQHPYLYYDGQEKFGALSAIGLSAVLTVAAVAISIKNRVQGLVVSDKW
jgi:uncharacterized membrane protein YpjA